MVPVISNDANTVVFVLEILVVFILGLLSGLVYFKWQMFVQVAIHTYWVYCVYWYKIQLKYSILSTTNAIKMIALTV